MGRITTRKANGVYYTPQPIVQYIVQRTLSILEHSDAEIPRVLDPACGDGAFLKEVYSLLSQRLDDRQCESTRRQVLMDSVFGVDCDQKAVSAARLALAQQAFARDTSEDRIVAELSHELRGNLQVGNALIDESIANEIAHPFDWKASFAEVFNQRGGFDAIVGNPPYVNIRLLSRSYGERTKQFLKRRYKCARRAYDLYVLFMEKALELLRPGGVCGMIVPNKIATMEYAEPCRRLLLEHATLEQITDVSDLRLFPDAGVYPYILIWRKRPPPRSHSIRVFHVASSDQLLQARAATRVRQSTLSAKGFRLHGSLAVEDRVPTAPLEERASLHSGTTGFSASRVGAELLEKESANGCACFEFIVSGNIDRYQVNGGHVRYMKRDYDRPVLPVAADCLSAGKRGLFQSAKIMIAGMTRRLEAAYDPGGLALGVQVYAAADLQDDPRYLLGVLNSKLLSHLFQLRFKAKRLAGGYLAINKSQLSQLPIRTIDVRDASEVAAQQQIIALVDQMLLPPDTIDEHDPLAHDSEIDQLVYHLYGVSSEEITAIENSVPADSRLLRSA
jgi:hypothetical protein